MSANAYDGVVNEIVEQGPDKPVMVGIGIHAAYFYVDRANPKFGAWMGILRDSEKHQKRIRFTYEVAGQWLTSVEFEN